LAIVLIKGSTTGEQILKIEKMMVNDTAQQKPLLAIRARFNPIPNSIIR
jgi:hypothetical protein